MKIILLKILSKIVYRFSEHPQPNVNYSERNYKVAKAVIAINELLMYFKTKQTT